MMKGMGIGASAAVTGMYRDFVNIFVLDHADHRQAAKIQRLSMQPVVTGTVMTGLRKKKALAAAVLSAMGVA